MAEKKQKKGPGFFSRTAKYFKDVKGELKKVVWPSKKQIINNTLIVIAVVIIAAILIMGLDLVFGEILKLVLKGA